MLRGLLLANVLHSILRLAEIGNQKNATNAERLPGWVPRPNEERAAATAEGLVKLGLLRDSPK